MLPSPAVIRITTEMLEQSTLVTIDGRLEDTDLPDLAGLRREIADQALLDLRGLHGCSPAGGDSLRQWLDDGARLKAASPFLLALLDIEPAPPRNPVSSTPPDPI